MPSKTSAQQTENLLIASSHILLQSLRLQNLLSFGPDTPELSLMPLNLLIGANGSGKSNLIDAISLLRSTPHEKGLDNTLGRGGGVTEWVWKGNPDGQASISAVVTNTAAHGLLQHVTGFKALGQAFQLTNEEVWSEESDGQRRRSNYEYRAGQRYLRIQGQQEQLYIFELNEENLMVGLDFNDSVLGQRRGSAEYVQITYLAAQYSKIRSYREWAFGRNMVFRQPQRADMRNDRLEEDFSNLGLFLNRMRGNPEAKKAILNRLRDIYDGVDDFDVSIVGGTVQVFLTEGRFTIPASRLSDGTLRYLCLLAILCDPTPPPLICIEEPELGLHPDILPKIADLLKEASQRTQLIVTTHSDILVDAMTETPEAVIVCEKHDGQTQMKRLSKDDLGVWLEKYRLGQLWTRGDIGGTRW